VLSVAVSPDGRSLAAGAMDGSVVVWDMGPGGGASPPRAVLTGHHKPVRQLAWTPGEGL
jgi:WD40 repeat protein